MCVLSPHMLGCTELPFLALLFLFLLLRRMHEKLCSCISSSTSIEVWEGRGRSPRGGVPCRVQEGASVVVRWQSVGAPKSSRLVSCERERHGRTRLDKRQRRDTWDHSRKYRYRDWDRSRPIPDRCIGRYQSIRIEKSDFLTRSLLYTKKIENNW